MIHVVMVQLLMDNPLLQGAIRYQEIFGLSFLGLLAAALFLAFVRVFFPTGGRT